MGNVIGIQISPGARNEGRLVDEKNIASTKKVQRLPIVEWYRILRVHHHWTIFQAIRFALWLSR